MCAAKNWKMICSRLFERRTRQNDTLQSISGRVSAQTSSRGLANERPVFIGRVDSQWGYAGGSGQGVSKSEVC